MDVFPEDLGVGVYQQILLRRAKHRGLWQTVQAETDQEVDYLASIWISGSSISKDTAKYAWPAFNLCLLWQKIIVCLTVLTFTLVCSVAGYMWFQSRPLVAEIIASSGVIVFIIGLLYGNIIIPRQIFSRLHDRLSKREVTHFQQNANDELKQTLFGLASAVVKLPQQSDKDLLRNIRQSLYALGSAIDDVQPEEHEYSAAEQYIGMGLSRERLQDKKTLVAYKQVMKSSSGITAPLVEPATLRKQADKLLSEATTEADPIIAASIKRRYASLLHQANTIDQITIFNRRNKALRGEISQQMNSLSTRLTASYLMRGNASQGLADVFNQITYLAAEASNVAAAQEELASALDDC